MNRTEHLQWCKNRAYEYLDVEDYTNACASFQSDMSKHTETATHAALSLMLQMQKGGMLSTIPEIRYFIEGFN